VELREARVVGGLRPTRGSGASEAGSALQLAGEIKRALGIDEVAAAAAVFPARVRRLLNLLNDEIACFRF
jgi:hypothetical protein